MIIGDNDQIAITETLMKESITMDQKFLAEEMLVMDRGQRKPVELAGAQQVVDVRARIIAMRSPGQRGGAGCALEASA